MSFQILTYLNKTVTSIFKCTQQTINTNFKCHLLYKERNKLFTNYNNFVFT